MDDHALVGILAGVAGLLVAGTLGTGGYLYASDYALQADVRATHCSVPSITVKTDALGIEHDVTGITVDECTKLLPGDHAVYHVRTKHTTIYRGGSCFYDSETGPLCGQAGPSAAPLGLL